MKGQWQREPFSAGRPERQGSCRRCNALNVHMRSGGPEELWESAPSTYGASSRDRAARLPAWRSHSTVRSRGCSGSGSKRSSMSQRPRVFKRSRRPPNNRLGLCVGSLEVKSNLALRVLLEIGALVAGGYWGWKSADGAARWALASRRRSRRVDVVRLAEPDDRVGVVPRSASSSRRPALDSCSLSARRLRD